MGMKRFEDLQAWQEARSLARIIYRLTRSERFAPDQGLRYQLQGAAVSLMSTIAGAHGRASPDASRPSLEDALGTGEELQSHLYVGLDQAYLTVAEFQEAYGQADRVAGRIGELLGNRDRQGKAPRPDRPPARQRRA